MKSVLVTGSNGFVGRALLPRFPKIGIQHIFALSRTQPAVPPRFPVGVHFRAIRGSVFDPSLYVRELVDSQAVIHLAASSNRCSREEHFRANADATRLLIEQCRRLNVKKFLYVSSIAARFPDKSSDFLAQAKEQAEELVRQSGLEFTIVRPTMVFGPGSPLLAAFARLAALPILPIFGDGKTRVQPIHVHDLTSFLLDILERNRFRGETLELGGPEVLTMEDLLIRVHRAMRSASPRIVHLPFLLVTSFVKDMERFFDAQLPFSSGQLTAFCNDGTIARNPLWEENRTELKTISSMLASLPSRT